MANVRSACGRGWRLAPSPPYPSPLFWPCRRAERARGGAQLRPRGRTAGGVSAMRLRPGVALVGMTILPSSVPGASGESLDDEELEEPDDAGNVQPPGAPGPASAGPGSAAASSFEVRRSACAQATGRGHLFSLHLLPCECCAHVRCCTIADFRPLATCLDCSAGVRFLLPDLSAQRQRLGCLARCPGLVPAVSCITASSAPGQVSSNGAGPGGHNDEAAEGAPGEEGEGPWVLLVTRNVRAPC